MTNKNDLRYIESDDFNGVCGICGKEIPMKNERIEVHIYLQDDEEWRISSSNVHAFKYP